MIKKILKIFAYLIGLWLFLFLVITGVTQTKLFKDQLRVFLTSTLEENLNANFDLGTIKGNFITGFSIDSVKIYRENEHFLSTGKVSLHHDPFTIWYKTMTIRSISVENPFVSIVKGSDSLWNINKIIKPTEDSTKAREFDWTIKIEDIKIVNGKFTMHDSLDTRTVTLPDTITKFLNYRRFNVEHLNLRFSGLVKNQQYKLNIKEFSGKLEETDFILNQMSGKFEITKNFCKVENFIITTRNSNLRIDAELDQFNLLDKIILDDLKESPLKLKLLANNLDLHELKSFIPQIYFLEGSAYADIEAIGKFGNFNITQLNLSTYTSILNSTGNIKNLHHPKDLFLNIKIMDSKINPGDVSKLLPYFNIPKVDSVKEALVSVSYTGTPLNFKSNINILSDAGNLAADLFMNLENKTMLYKCNLITKNINPEKIFGNNLFKSSINSNIDIEGQGTNLENLKSTLKMKIDSSKIYGISVYEAEFFTETDKKKINSTMSVKTNSFNANLETKHDLTDIQHPKTVGAFSFSSVDLSNILRDIKFSSDLNFNATISATGKNIDELSGDLKMNLLPSTIGKYEIDNENITISLDQFFEKEKNLIIQSPYFELDLNGKFLLSEIPFTFASLTENFIDALEARIGERHPEKTKIVATLPKSHFVKDEDYQFLLTVYDISPIAQILEKTPFNYHGTISGNIRNSESGYSAFAGEINFADFFIGTANSGFLMSNGQINFDIDSLTEYNLFENILGKVRGTIQTASINKTQFQNIILHLDYRDLTGNVIFDCMMDKIAINVSGGIDIYPNSFGLVIDKFNLRLDDYKWESTKDITISFSPAGFNISDFTLSRNQKEILSIYGDYFYDGKLNFNGNIKNFDIYGLKFILKNLNVPTNIDNLFGTLNTDVLLIGTTVAPVISMTTSIDSIIYQNTNFGNLRSHLQYNEKTANVSIEIKSKNKKENKPDFKIKGNFPIDLAFTDIEKRIPDRAVSMSIVSDSFQLALLSPLISVMDDLRGTLICDVSITGTPAAPIYSGNIELLDTRFILNTNKITYNVTGVLEPEGNKINFSNFIITNNKQDYSDGKLSINGYFHIKDFNVDNFDIRAKGQLLLLKETQQKTLQNIQGRLIGIIGSNGLHYTGRFSKSHLSGSVQIKEANLTFPPMKGTSYYESGNNLRYIVIDDTTKQANITNLKKQFFYAGSGSTDTLDFSEKRESKFWQGLSYDISLETHGTSIIKLIFNSATKEELYAELDGKVNLQRIAGKDYTIGEIAISERSYYNFFKKFDASGGLKFLGEASNPEFDIKANYSGYRILADTNATPQKVVITLKISGNRLEPNLKMDITIDEKDYSQVIQGGDLQSDAISFLFTGKFRDDLSTGEKSSIVSSVGSSAGQSILTGAATTMLSGILTEFLRKEFGFIRSAEISYTGGKIEEKPDLRLSGEIFKAYWKFGGKIFDNINNANFSFILNFGDVFEAHSVRNLYLELERKDNGGELSLDRKFTNTARIYYKWSF